MSEFSNFSEDDLESSMKISERAAARVPDSGLEEMNINDYIASLTDMSNNPILPELSKDLKKAAGMYAYLRDKHGAQKIGDALSVLRCGEVDAKVVQLWVEEGMANDATYDPIAEGYPFLVKELERIRKERTPDLNPDIEKESS